LAFVTKMGEKRKSASSNAIQVKNRRETISTEVELNVISSLEEDERIVYIWHNVKLLIAAYVKFVIILRELQKSAKSGPRVFV
jgi:hypothetical protein